MFDSIATLAVASNMRELYRLVLVDTPLAPYFSECISSEDLDEMNVEIMRNILYKAYLSDFLKFCEKLGGATAILMKVSSQCCWWKFWQASDLAFNDTFRRNILGTY